MGEMGPQALRDLFSAVLPRDADTRMMGGSPAAVVNGNLFMRVRRTQFVLRLSKPHRAELLRVPGATTFEPIPGRPMPEYVVVPPNVLSDQPTLLHWVRCSHDYAKGLTPQASGGVPQAQPRKQAAKTVQIPRLPDDPAAR